MPADTPTDDKTPPTSQSPLPEVSLPKGGGAIQGIGEKFSTNAMTGTGSITVPIATSKARSGFGPALALSYDSGSGNGVFGVGWSLSLPHIVRKTDKGLPQYRDREESDVFILSGSEDLVPVLRRGLDGGWEPADEERDGFRIRFYRPRVEGLFARIERWTGVRDGEIHWRSFTKDNVLTIYGDTAETRISDPNHPHHVFKWLISSSYDGRGNAIRYRYAEEDVRGGDQGKPSERRRPPPSNRYLKRILFGNRLPLSNGGDSCEAADWMFEIVFDFGDEGYRREQRPDGEEYVELESQAGESCWPVRSDPFSTYRSGFEIRTYRLCRRSLMFHRFPEELGTDRCLVRSTEFYYDGKKIGSFLTAIVQSGYTRSPDGAYLKKSLPPVEFGYTPSPLEDDAPGPFELREADSANLPEGIDDSNYRWVDLDSEGISGALSEQGAGWYFKRNLGSGRFAAIELIASKPATARLGAADQRLLDVAGDGQLDIVDLAPGRGGFFERTHEPGEPLGLEAGWGRFRPFRALPVVNWNGQNLRFVDLTGDGIADILITEDVAFRWHPSLEEAGFGQAIRITAPADEDEGPRVVFADPTQSIHLADMSGDGLTDIVRIRNSEICYWPNLGYGRFGPKVLMDRSPWFDAPGLFDSRRIRLADTDGSGTTDILYVASDRIHVYLNESGNSLSPRKTLRGLPAPGNDGISLVDFLGRGTACLVWSSPLRSDALRPLRYVDLMRGEKPHLLTRMSNNLGAETAIEYASSTEFYLADRAAGHHWVTPLPFPVHVVRRVESFDAVSRHRFVSTMSYHHGYFDKVEREFRGFGRVDHVDTEDFASGEGRPFPAGANDEMAWRVAPVLTKTWYHTGVFLGVNRVSRHLAHEYYHEPGEPAEMRLEDTILPCDLTPEEAREASRALKGLQLRQEIYALDGSEAASRPYTVSEGNATVRLFQPQACNRHCVVYSHGREMRTLNYERRLYRVDGALRADPRVTQSVTLEVDDYGNVLASADLAHGRRFPDPCELLTDADHARQATFLATAVENVYTNVVYTTAAYRTPALAEARTYELVHLDPRPLAHPLRFDDIRRLVARAGDGRHDLPFEDFNAEGATDPSPYRRLIKASRNLFRADALDRLLPLGELEPLALSGESYSLALTRGLIAQVYGDKLRDSDPILPRDGGYTVDGDGSWWVPSGRMFFSPDVHDDPSAELAYARRHFFLPHRFRDTFGNVSHVAYDSDDLAPVETDDPVGNIVRARFDYRVLQPCEVTDANGNRSSVAFDSLARLAGTAVMGKIGERSGDSLEGFVADLPEHVVHRHLGDPLKDPNALLGNATTRLIYDPFAFDRTRREPQLQPAVIYSLARETHAADLGPGAQTKIQHAFSYSDGLGREVQKKLQAEPGSIAARRIANANPRWVGSGWTIFNNKGKPVRQYEPFFSTTHHFEFGATVGVASTLVYDPVGRLVATINPNHTFQKRVFDPWRQDTWDVNDTVLADPAQDPDIGPLVRLIPAEDYLPTWYKQRSDGGLGPAEHEAALKAAVHAGTPATAFGDPIGRTFLTVAHNRFPHGDAVVDEFYATRSVLDIQGNERAVSDARGRIIMTYDYDIGRRRIHQNSSDAGERWVVSDVTGKPVLRFDSRHHRLRNEYDALRRPTALFVRKGNDPEKLAERAEYGEGQPNAEEHNLRGRLYRQLDEAGVVTTPLYDFKGNLLRSFRQMLANYRDEVDWAASPQLETEVFLSESSYDALNRPLTLTAPDRSVVRPGYNEANLLERLDVCHKGSASFTPFVTNIDYNAKGQRELIEYSNGVRTASAFDPLTFRLTQIKTTRTGEDADLQNLSYAYDPVGNISSIADVAQPTIYFKNQVVAARRDYRYDANYRLIEAEGREHAGRPDLPETTYDDASRLRWPLPGDGRAMQNYRERYRYDAVGNILELLHAAPEHGSWRRHYRYAEIDANNRLTGTSVGELEGRYAYDPHGNITRMPHLPALTWDFKDQLASTQAQVVSEGRHAATTYYAYDSGGQRARKVTDDAVGKRRVERIYVGVFEVYREYGSDGESVHLERQTLQVMDDKRRVALVESRGDETTVRYQFDDHLGSCCLELDEKAAILTYEEYYPYGSTSYQAGRSVAETSLKRYRFTGKERDGETGLYYHTARYYAPWLGRWTSCDPVGLVDGLNQYQYVLSNPIGATDPTGRWSTGWTIAAVVGIVVLVAVVTVVTLGAGTAPAAAGGAALLGAGAEAAAATTAVVATGAEVAAGATAAIATGAEVAAGTTAVVASGAEVAAGTTAVVATSAEVAGGATAVAATGAEAATVTTGAVATGAEVTGSATAVAGSAGTTTAAATGTGAITGSTAGTGLAASQVTAVGTAATAVATAAGTPAGQEVIQTVGEDLPAIENEVQVSIERAQFYIENGVRRSVASREAGLSDIPATIYREGHIPENTTLRLDQLFSPKAEIPLNQRFLNIEPPIHTPIAVQPLGLPGQLPTVPLDQVKIIPAGG
jgi:RHS repeat-associated protein